MFPLLNCKPLTSHLLGSALLSLAVTLLPLAALHVTAQKPRRNEKPQGRDAVPSRAEALAPTTQCPITPPTDPAQCGGQPCVVDITENDPNPRQTLKDAIARDNTTVRLAPNLNLDFSGLEDKFFPIEFGRCSRLVSVNSFESGAVTTARAGRRQPSKRRRGGRGRDSTNVPPLNDLEVELPERVGSARTPRSLGPILRYGTNHPLELGAEPALTFLQIRCFPGDQKKNDGARVSGFRLYGPSPGPQKTDEVGIRILSCVDVEVSNMEISGWGGAGIKIGDFDEKEQLLVPEGCVKLPLRPGSGFSQDWKCADGEVVTTGPPGPRGRITRPDQVRIFNNFIHHNQHPSSGGHATGYGINVGPGAWAQITENVFDFNRHAIAANGRSGGYDARRNLVLTGGGYHRARKPYTHQFDVHGDSDCGVWPFWGGDANCGNAGNEFWFVANSFHYRNDHAIEIRGQPRIKAHIWQNIFPHEGLEDDKGPDAIGLQTKDNVEIANNKIEVDSFGKYQVCDIDGDSLDDLFLATGATWWYSSQGKYHWSYLSAKTEKWDEVKVGYFDDDLRCDVLTEKNGQWLFSSGGYGDWQSLGRFDAPLSEIEFGRFDDSPKDRAGVRRTPHAFRRGSDGQWFVTALYKHRAGDAADWKERQSSGIPMKQLKFGDFTGDGITDVLAVENGHWSISKSALGDWEQHNERLRNDVSTLLVANMDTDDNIDDILRVDRSDSEVIWWRSRNGKKTWERLDAYLHLVIAPRWEPAGLPVMGFVGRFKSSPVWSTLVINPNRTGRFFNKAEADAGRAANWYSAFSY